MFAAYVVITVVTILANGGIAVADLVPARFVLANMDEVGVPRPWLPRLAVLKGTAAAGLLIGLLGLRPLGIAAAAGLVLFFTGCGSRARTVPSAMMSPSGHRHWTCPPSNCSWYSDAYSPPWRSRSRCEPDSVTRPRSMT